jgi:hypothetical protein
MTNRIKTVNDIRFGGKVGRPNIAYITWESAGTMFISNYQWWLKGFRKVSQSRFDDLVKAIEHETIHLILAENVNKFTSKRFDRLRTQMRDRVLDVIGYKLW